MSVHNITHENMTAKIGYNTQRKGFFLRVEKDGETIVNQQGGTANRVTAETLFNKLEELGFELNFVFMGHIEMDEVFKSKDEFNWSFQNGELKATKVIVEEQE